MTRTKKERALIKKWAKKIHDELLVDKEEKIYHVCKFTIGDVLWGFYDEIYVPRNQRHLLKY